MAIAHVQSTSGVVGTPATTNAKAFASGVTAGNLLICAVQWVTATRTCTVADDVNGAWTEATSKQSVTNGALQIFYRQNTASGTITVTATFDDTTNSTVAIHEYSGLLTSGALDKAAGATGAAGTSGDSGNTATTTVATELLFGAVQTSGNSGGFTKDANYTARINVARILTEDRIVAAKAAYNATATWVNSLVWVCQVATFKGVETASVSAAAATTSAVEGPVPTVTGGATVAAAAAETKDPGVDVLVPAVTGGATVAAEYARAAPVAALVPTVTGGAAVAGEAATASAAAPTPVIPSGSGDANVDATAAAASATAPTPAVAGDALVRAAHARTGPVHASVPAVAAGATVTESKFAAASASAQAPEVSGDVSGTAVFRQGTHGTASASSITLAYTIPVDVNSLLLVGLSWTDVAKSVTLVEDESGNTFAPVSTKITNTGVAMQLWYLAGAEAGDTEITATLDGSTGVSMFILEYQGIAIESPIIDEQAHATGSGTPADSGLTGTTSCGDMLVFGILGLAGGATELDPGPGFTQREQMVRLMGMEKSLTGDAQYNATASWTEAGDVAWCCQVVVFAAFVLPEPSTPTLPDQLPFKPGVKLSNLYLPLLQTHPEIDFVYTTSTALAKTHYISYRGKLRALVGTTLALLESVAEAAITPATLTEYDVLAYNLENKEPGGEWEDVEGSVEAAIALAATYGKPLMPALGGELFDLTMADDPDLIPHLATQVDYWLFQCQRQQIYPVGDEYKEQIWARLEPVLTANPDITIVVQVSSWRGHFGGGVPMTPAQMCEYIACLAELVEEQGITIRAVNLYDDKDPDPPAIIHGVLDLLQPSILTLRRHFLSGTVDRPRATIEVRRMRLDFGNALCHYNDGAVLTGTAIGDDAKDENQARPIWGDSVAQGQVFVRVVSPMGWGDSASNELYVSRAQDVDEWALAALLTTSAPTFASRVRLGLFPAGTSPESYYVWGLDANNDLVRCTLQYSGGAWSWTDATTAEDIGSVSGAAVHPVSENSAIIVAYDDPFLKCRYATWSGAAWTLSDWYVLAASDQMVWSDAHWSDAEALPGDSERIVIAYNTSTWGTALSVVFDTVTGIYGVPRDVLPSTEEWGSLRVWVSGLTVVNGRVWAVTTREAVTAQLVPMIHHVALVFTTDGINWSDDDFVSVSALRGKLLAPDPFDTTFDRVYVVGNASVATSVATLKVGYDNPDLLHTLTQAHSVGISHGGPSSVPEITVEAMVDSTEDDTWLALIEPRSQVTVELGAEGYTPQLMATGTIMDQAEEKAFVRDTLAVRSLGQMSRILGGESYMPITAKVWEGPYYLYSDFQMEASGLAQLTVRQVTGTWVTERIPDVPHYVLWAKAPGIALLPQSIRERGFIFRFAFQARVAIEGLGAVFWYEDELNYWWAGLYNEGDSTKLEIRKVVNGGSTVVSAVTATGSAVEEWETMFLQVRPGYVRLSWMHNDTYAFDAPDEVVEYDLLESGETEAPPAEFHVGFYLEGFEGIEGADKSGTVTDSDTYWLEDTAQTFEASDIGSWVKVGDEDRRIVAYETNRIIVNPGWGADLEVGDEYGIYPEERKDGPRCYIREMWFCEAALPPTVDEVTDGILALAGCERDNSMFTGTAVAVSGSADAEVLGDLDIEVLGDQVKLSLFFWCGHYVSTGENAFGGYLVDLHEDTVLLSKVNALGASSPPYQSYTNIAYHPSYVAAPASVERTMRVIASKDLLVVACDGQFITAFPNLGYGPEGYVMRSAVYSTSATRREFMDVVDSYAWDAATNAASALERLLQGRRAKIVELADGSIGVSRFEEPRSDLGEYDVQVVAVKAPRNVEQLLPVIECVGAEVTAFWLDPEVARYGLKYRRMDNPTVWSREHAIREAKRASELGLARYNAGEVLLYAPDPDAALEKEFEVDGVEYIVDSVQMSFSQSEKGPGLACQIRARKKPVEKAVETWDSATADYDKDDHWG